MSLSWLWYLSVVPALGFLIFVHELGHFVTALRMGIKVEEFGFGYPPRMLTLFRYRDVPVTINWLPLGGFVRMAGEEGNFDAEGSLAQAPPWKKIPVMAAGAIMNLLTAMILFAIIGMAGQPDPIGPVTIIEVVPGSPAAAALKPGDVILKVDGETVDSPGTLRRLIDERVGRQVILDVQSVNENGATELKNVRIRPRTEAERGPRDGALGVEIGVPAGQSTGTRYINRLNPLSAVGYGLQHTVSLLFQMLAGLGALLASLFGFAPSPEGSVAGVVGITRLTGQIAQRGLLQLLDWTAVLSVNLALINLLPLPALDGSRIVFAFVEWIRGGKRVPPEREAMVHAVGMMLLLGLMLVITFSDVRNWISGYDAFGQ
ncbi:MAG TPA: M50 family metallopeptidase [Herpetosiphonaceae bacterium]|nr:M50 family metallopeptidase [Herpetosiphonaceae bacterium]